MESCHVTAVLTSDWPSTSATSSPSTAPCPTTATPGAGPRAATCPWLSCPQPGENISLVAKKYLADTKIISALWCVSTTRAGRRCCGLCTASSTGPRRSCSSRSSSWMTHLPRYGNLLHLPPSTCLLPFVSKHVLYSILCGNKKTTNDNVF